MKEKKMSDYSITPLDVDGYLIYDEKGILDPGDIVEMLYRLAEYENDETARRRADAFKIRQLKADILVLERKYRDLKQGR